MIYIVMFVLFTDSVNIKFVPAVD